MSTLFCCMINMNKSQGNRILLEVDIRFHAGRGRYVQQFHFYNHWLFGIIQGQRVIHTIKNLFFYFHINIGRWRSYTCSVMATLLRIRKPYCDKKRLSILTYMSYMSFLILIKHVHWHKYLNRKNMNFFLYLNSCLGMKTTVCFQIWFRLLFWFASYKTYNADMWLPSTGIVCEHWIF